VNLIKSLRISLFVQNEDLHKYQRYFINKFRKYHLSAKKEENDFQKESLVKYSELSQAGYNIECYDKDKMNEMIGHLDSTKNRMDRHIIYELTGEKVDKNETFIKQDSDEEFFKMPAKEFKSTEFEDSHV
jgi:hypothetical protein